MTVRRAACRGDAVATILRAALQDVRLSYRATGVLAAVLSRPLDWRTSAAQLARERPTGEGRDAVLSALRELETCGYLTRHVERDQAGRLTTTWDITDAPGTDSPDERPTQVTGITAGQTGAWKTGSGQPGSGPPGVLHIERQPLETPPPTPQPTIPAAGAHRAAAAETTTQAMEVVDENSGQDDDALAAAAAAVAALLGALTVSLPPALAAAVRAARRGPVTRALEAMAGDGWTSEQVAHLAAARSWQGAHTGAVVVWLRGLTVLDQPGAAALRGPARQCCPEHPGVQLRAGCCDVCLRQAATAQPPTEILDVLARRRGRRARQTAGDRI